MSESTNTSTTGPAFQPDLRVGFYALAMMLSFAWLMIWLADHPVLAVLAIVSAAMTFLFRTWFVGFIYFLALGFLFIVEPSQIRNVGGLLLSEWVFAFGVMTFLISANRYLVLTSPVLSYGSLSLTDAVRESIEFVRSITMGAAKGKVTQRATKNSRLEARDRSTVTTEELISAAARILVSICVASVILIYVAPDRSSRREFGVTMDGFRAASLSWLLIGSVLLLGFLFTPISWLRHSPLQAGVYLRTQMTRWCFGDLRRMVRRLVKDRQKSKVHRLGRGKAIRVPVLDTANAPVRVGGDSSARADRASSESTRS